MPVRVWDAGSTSSCEGVSLKHGREEKGTNMIGKSVVKTKLASEPFCQRLEASTQDGHLETKSLQALAQFARTGRDGNHRLQLVENICRNSFEQTDTFLERLRKVELAIHGTFCDFLSLTVSMNSDKDARIRGILPKPPSPLR